ncbi:glycosyltransferase family protein [Rivularia sp. UHCC 0363]|uniref:glycosyltransferase family protein n=1 Tax=Rivularia sp. UHCC 0363 TaxID=3110244 RepID=UPI002B209ED5|nr:glycosyltransferase [Rivularia sp. UHCC 0363]MEA5594576.1 glycosyltransferase [Rivularia sp. UHCC 0363]
MRLMVYSHDAFGLGNIRRMLAICEHLVNEIPQLSILLLSGSPMLQGFRLPKRLDYIKLPCLNRGNTGEVAVKFLEMGIDETIKLRSQLILSAAINFKPDVFLVDKKPLGIKNELKNTVNYLHKHLPKTKLVLLLRDILDAPEKTINEWVKHQYHQTIDKFYQLLLVVGLEEVFDLCQEYKLPATIVEKVRFCGYIRRPHGCKTSKIIRQELQLTPKQKLVLVTPGGGEDGYQLVNTYLQGQELLKNSQYSIKNLVFCGPEMPKEQKQELYKLATKFPQVEMREFTNNLMSYISAADAVVSMGGYNTICEILSAAKPAVIVPRIKPSEEQLVRAERMRDLGLLKSIHPKDLTPQVLMTQLFQVLENPKQLKNIDLEGLPRIARHIRNLLTDKITEAQPELIYPQPNQFQQLLAS